MSNRSLGKFPVGIPTPLLEADGVAKLLGGVVAVGIPEGVARLLGGVVAVGNPDGVARLLGGVRLGVNPANACCNWESTLPRI